MMYVHKHIIILLYFTCHLMARAFCVLLLSKQHPLTQSICHIRIGGTIWDCGVFKSISGPLTGRLYNNPNRSIPISLPFPSLGNHSESYYGNHSKKHRTETNGCLPLSERWLLALAPHTCSEQVVRYIHVISLVCYF